METRESPFRAKSGAAAANFECNGSIRKAGFLSVKKWLLRKKHSLELARKRGWKRFQNFSFCAELNCVFFSYWVCLKGTTLLFYCCESRDGRSIDSNPKHLIFIDEALVQSIPEHPKRDFVICLSTAFGDAYLMDAPCISERDNWINAIHCACASSIARHRGRSGVAHVLNDECAKLDRQIELDLRQKHETELTLTVSESKQQLLQTLITLDERIERMYLEHFRFRCYQQA